MRPLAEPALDSLWRDQTLPQPPVASASYLLTAGNARESTCTNNASQSSVGLYHFRSGTERHFDTQPGKAGFLNARNANAFQTKAADGNRTHISSLGRRPQARCASPGNTRKLVKLSVWRHFKHCNEVQSRAFVCDHVYPEVGRSGYRLCRAPTLSDCTLAHPETRFNQQ